MYSTVTNQFKRPLTQAVIKLEDGGQKIRSYYWHKTEAQAIRSVSATETPTVLCGRRWMFPEQTVNGRSLYVCLQIDTPVHRHLPSTSRGHKNFPTPTNKHIILMFV